MKCPVCQQVHRRRDYSSSVSCSHGALLVYVTTQCPICLEEKPDPPMIALPCGHLLCQTDFGRLGGHILTAEQEHRCSNCGGRRHHHHHHLPEVSSSEDDEDDSDYGIFDDTFDEVESVDGVESEEEEEDEEYDEMQTPLLAATMRRMQRVMDQLSSVASSEEDNVWEDEDSDDSSWESSEDSDDESEESSVSFSHVELADEFFSASEPGRAARISTPPPPAARGRRNRRHGPHWCPDATSVTTAATMNDRFTSTGSLVTSVSRRRRRALRGGAWLLVPDESDNTTSTLTYKDDEHCFTLDAYPRASRLILDGHNGVFVYAPLTSSSSGDRSAWQVFHVNLERTVQKYNMARSASQIVSDGNSGIWALCGNKLMHANCRYRSGRVIRKLPGRSLLVLDKTGGVWIHIKQLPGGTSSNDNMTPGLWHFTTRSQERIMDLHEDSQCIADGHGGVWTLSPCRRYGIATLSRVRAGGQKTERLVCVDSNPVKIIYDGKDGVYIHGWWEAYGRWGLSHMAENGEGQPRVCDCPKDAPTLGDGVGGVWILKRVRGRPFRLLLHVNRQGCVEGQDKYPLGTVLSRI